MIQPLTPVVELQSRLGRVGSIQAWNPWGSRKSVAHAKWWVSKVASLSYGNDAAKNPEKLFQSIVDRGHLSCLEFVPSNDTDLGALPACSMRHVAPPKPGYWEKELVWMDGDSEDQELLWELEKENPATAFLVECPLYIRSQWTRHRSFSYLELSRRYTKGSKVEWEYYAPQPIENQDGTRSWDSWASFEKQAFHTACEAEYQRRLDVGWPNEIARGCMPVEAMTKFWVAGFDRDWDAFIALRDDPHAQPEIRVFASWIKQHLHPEQETLDVANLGN